MVSKRRFTLGSAMTVAIFFGVTLGPMTSARADDEDDAAFSANSTVMWSSDALAVTPSRGPASESAASPALYADPTGNQVSAIDALMSGVSSRESLSAEQLAAEKSEQYQVADGITVMGAWKTDGGGTRMRPFQLPGVGRVPDELKSAILAHDPLATHTGVVH